MLATKLLHTMQRSGDAPQHNARFGIRSVGVSGQTHATSLAFTRTPYCPIRCLIPGPAAPLVQAGFQAQLRTKP
eukprot:3404423-Amphidinium_carterae.1